MALENDNVVIRQKPSLLWIAFLSFIAIGLQGSALNVAWLYMQDSFGKSLDSIGIVLLAGTFGGLILSFYSGRILSILSVGWVCFLATVLEVFALLVISFTPHWSIFVAASVLLGLGRSGINVAMNTFVAERYPSSRMNWLHAIFGIGATAGPLLVTFIVVNLARNWQTSYLLIACIQSIIAILFLLSIKDWQLSATTSQEKVSHKAQRVSFKTTLRLRAVWLGIGLFVCHVGLQMSTGQLTNSLLVEGRGIDPKLAGLWISLFWAFLTLGRIAFALFIDQFGVAKVLRFCTLGSVLAAGLIALNLSASLSFFGIALMGFTLAPVFPSSVSRTPAMVGRLHSPNAIGFQMTGAGLGGAFIPGFIGFIADSSSLEFIPIALFGVAVAQFVMHELLSAYERKQGISQT